MVLNKLSVKSEFFNTIIGGTICEYDIKSAGATAIRELKGEEIYKELMKMDKIDRNIKIGLMMRDEKGLSSKVNECMLNYLNTFITKNKITEKHFVYSTRDSIVLYNKIPKKTKFGNVVFRNKDGIFSSFYSLGRLAIFFDSMSYKVICKGVSDKVCEESPFINEYLKKYLKNIEVNYGAHTLNFIKILKSMREDYISSDNIRIYKSLFDENRYNVKMEDDIVQLDNVDNTFDILRERNYIEIVLPIMRSVITKV